jgi:hypothetical protein
MQLTRLSAFTLIAMASAILFIHSLGNVHLFDWDEINFAESAREMIETKDYMRVQINYEPFWEKPPLFFWMQVVSMKIFGVGEFAARLPNAICGIVTLLVLFGIGRRVHDMRFAGWWVLIHAGTFLAHLYFKSGIIDPWFNLFIFLGIHFLSAFLSQQPKDTGHIRTLMLSALFTGMAVLTKGPVGLLVVLLTYFTYILLNRGKGWVPFRYYLYWALGVLAVTLVWFGLEVMQHGWWFVNEFFTYQIRLAQTKDAGHGGFPGYHFIVLLIGCFPASLLIFSTGSHATETGRVAIFRKMMIASLIVILVVFSLVKTKIIHYSSFAYFPIGYLAATTVYGLLTGTVRIRTWQSTAILIIGVIWSIAFIGLPLVGNNIHWLKPLLAKDPFAVANLQADVTWGYHLMLPGILFLAAVILATIRLRRQQYHQAFLWLFLSAIFVMQVLLTSFAPRIEQYSQHAAIEFFKSLKGQDVYVETVGYKSYGPYFYFGVKPGNRKESKDEQWLLTADLDKPAYLVTRLNKKDRVLAAHGQRLVILYEKNGFVFMKRK